MSEMYVRLYEDEKMSNCQQLQVGNSLQINQFLSLLKRWINRKQQQQQQKQFEFCGGEFL